MDDAANFGHGGVTDPVSHVRVDRTIVLMDVPNIMGSARRAAGGSREGARFSFDNILAAIRRSHTPGYTEREIVEAHAVMLMRDRPDLQRAVQANLERAGFRVHLVVQKHPRQARQVSFHAHVPCDRSSIVAEMFERYGMIVQSSDRRDPIDRHIMHVSGIDYQGEQGVTDLEVTNLAWATLMDQFKLGHRIDTVVLIAGDGDYKGLVSRIKKFGVRIEVYGPFGATSRSLQTTANKVVFMSHLTPENVPEKQRFIFFKKDSGGASEDPDDSGYGIQNALIDADNPFLTSDTGEWGAAGRG